MKINYLLYSVAFASAFAACSDELTEVANAPVNDALAGRPVVGNVTLNVSKAGEAETRLNEAGTAFTQGDKVKLFLMDEYMLGTEEWNANMTDFKSQDVWFNMYNMVDYIHTNYIYDFDGTDFYNNAAQLVEGNYFAFYQENESYREHELTNRQDLWAYINPVMKLDQKTANVYANMENDIYLDYQQFYREEEAGPQGKLVKDMSMKPVMNRVKFSINNLNNAAYLIKRIVIKKTLQDAVPTLAYIRPYAPGESARPYTTGTLITDWNNEVMNDDLATMGATFEDYYTSVKGTPAEADFNNKFTRHEVYDNFVGTTKVTYTYNGGKKAFTQEDARNITYFETTANGRIPYGLKKENAAPAFEYVIEFPGEGHILNANAPYTSTERVDVYAALPVFADMFNELVLDPISGDMVPAYEIHVDGAYNDITKGDPSHPGKDENGDYIWTPGYWDASLPSGIANTKWKMEKAFDHDWTVALGQNWPEGSLTIDFNDMHLLEEEVGTRGVIVSSTKELLDALKASALDGSQYAAIMLNGVGIEFNDAVKAQIEANAKAYELAHPGSQYEVYFAESNAWSQEGNQNDNSTTDYPYSGSGNAGQDWYVFDPASNQYENFTTTLVVTAEDVLGLPTNIRQICATYVADQTITKEATEFIFGTGATTYTISANKTFYKNVTVEDGITFDVNGGSFFNGAVINLNAKGAISVAYVDEPNATVTVLGGADASVEFDGNAGKIILESTSDYVLDTDGVTKIWKGMSTVIKNANISITNDASGVVYFQKKKDNKNATPDYTSFLKMNEDGTTASYTFDATKNYWTNDFTDIIVADGYGNIVLGAAK